ncbi:uncharacterized protein TRIADDRAFT_54002 [Trichoplax adhaerens]|uniref:EF-hand domain-containing protein n=1 Tax=Trichoplax adhaerens TaxID=10228 RepID=B3RQU5_TRIAD|nr:hypothetical protein TRIADDRAFT_54002 [Trichoplax adhaerens]EDV26766.1 hypothetical protein TRIADDRAFT_54002 [Trichoplax adhaerens]|eukprot:XP_002110762.1 hypothetical protein TRIADDRAFT_54002 [Trichoplax adhaerens]
MIPFVQVFNSLSKLSSTSGSVDMRSFIQCFHLQGILSRRLFAILDTDKDNRLSQEEFIGREGIIESDMLTVLKSVILHGKDPNLNLNIEDIMRDAYHTYHKNHSTTANNNTSWQFGRNGLPPLKKQNWIHQNRPEDQKLISETNKSIVPRSYWIYKASQYDLSPELRSQHSACYYNGCIYVYGGRTKYSTLRDFWKFNLFNENWENVQPRNDYSPSSRHGQTTVVYRNKLYLFGGQFSDQDEASFWIYNFEFNLWSPFEPDGSMIPSTRRNHTASIINGAMYIFGGYIDFRGSTNELWSYAFESDTWELVYPLDYKDSNSPLGRYAHSTVVHDNALWIFGGLNDLNVTNDLWKWDILQQQWRRIKSKSGPPPLCKHSAVKTSHGMAILGGESYGVIMTDLWLFDFGTTHWRKIQLDRTGIEIPLPYSRHVLLSISSFMLPAQLNQSSWLVHLRPGSSPASFLSDNTGENHEKLVANLSTPHIQRLSVAPANSRLGGNYSPDALSIVSGDSQQSTTSDSQEQETNSYQEPPIPTGMTCFYVLGSHEIMDPNKAASKSLDIWKCYFNSI